MYDRCMRCLGEMSTGGCPRCPRVFVSPQGNVIVGTRDEEIERLKARIEELEAEVSRLREARQ